MGKEESIQDLLDGLEEAQGEKESKTNGKKKVKEKPIRIDNAITGMMAIEKLKFTKDNRDSSEKFVNELAESIKEFGMIIPIIINKDNKILDGERRVRACIKIGVKEVPFIVKNKNIDITMVVANYMRENLTNGEVKEIIEREFGDKVVTQEQIGKKFGLTQGRVSQILKKKPKESKKSKARKAKRAKTVKKVKLPQNIRMIVRRNSVEITFILDNEMLKNPIKSMTGLFKEIKNFQRMVDMERI